jgi:hypothetical protein
MYPKGFRYRRACINDPAKCTHVLEETLNLTKLQWDNTRALTPFQRQFMSSRQPRSKTLDEIQRYRDDFTVGQTRRVEIQITKDAAVAFVLKSPSVSEYIDSGYRWVGGIQELVDRVLGADADAKTRDQLIMDHGRASAMQQYAHWVQHIELGTNIIEDVETIESNLEMMSSDDEVRVKFVESVVTYINDTTMSLIGIPVYECPACQMDQEITDQGPYRNLIPLDVMSLFFALTTQRLQRLRLR